MMMTMTMIRGESGGKDGYYSTAFSKLYSVRVDRWSVKKIEKRKQSWTDGLPRNGG